MSCNLQSFEGGSRCDKYMTIVSIGIIHLCIEDYQTFYINVTKLGISIHIWMFHLDLDRPFYNHGSTSPRTYGWQRRESSRGS